MKVDEFLSPVVGLFRSTISIAAGQMLFSAGAPTAGVYVVLSGRIKLERTNAKGREAVLFVANPGDPFAEAAIFSDVYHCSAVAIVDSVVRLYPKNRLLPEFQRNIHFAQGYAAILGQQLMATRTRLERNGLHSARDRVRHFLAVEAVDEEYNISSPGSLKELAVELNLTPEALYRTIAQMVKDRDLTRTNDTIKLNDIKA